MGFKVNWLVFGNTDAESALASMGLRGSGERSDWPQGPLAATTLPDGRYLVVESYSDASVAGTYDLAALSKNCELIACSELDNAGFSETQIWRDGELVWSAIAEDQELTLTGDLPPVLLPYAELIRRAEQYDEDDDEDLDDDFNDPFNLTLKLATSLTGYTHGTGADEQGAPPFETLEKAGAADLLTVVSTALSEALAPHGFQPAGPLGATRTPRFTAPSPIPTAVLSVRTSIERYGLDSVELDGRIALLCPAAADFYTALPPEAQLAAGSDHEQTRRGEIAGTFYSLLQNKQLSASGYHIFGIDQVPAGIHWFTNIFTTRATPWFTAHTLEALIHLAKTDRWRSHDAIRSSTPRLVIALCVLADAPDQAAALMSWYQSQPLNESSDSLDRLRAFDQALAAHSAAYATARDN